VYAIRFLRIYDTGDEIDLDRLENTLRTDHSTMRATFTRVQPKSISMEVPPLLVRLTPLTISSAGDSYPLCAIARIYDIGAVSICLVLESMDQPPSAILRPAFQFAGQKASRNIFRCLEDIRDILRPHLGELPVEPASSKTTRPTSLTGLIPR